MMMAGTETEGGDGQEESISSWVPVGEAATHAIAEVLDAYRAALAFDPITPEAPDHAETGPTVASITQNARI